MKVIFLDRDGIINKERGDYTWQRDHFEFTTNLNVFLSKYRDEGYKFIVITNQGGIEKGIYNIEDVEYLHKWMIEELRRDKIEILDVFYCPHHSDIQKCLCRKPNSLLLEKAVAMYGVDKNASYMIGDRQRDVDAGEKIGIKGVLMDPNPDWNEVNLILK